MEKAILLHDAKQHPMKFLLLLLEQLQSLHDLGSNMLVATHLEYNNETMLGNLNT